MIITPLNSLEKLLKKDSYFDKSPKRFLCGGVELPYKDKKNFLGLVKQLEITHQN